MSELKRDTSAIREQKWPEWHLHTCTDGEMEQTKKKKESFIV